jgi:hypothetical protein
MKRVDPDSDPCSHDNPDSNANGDRMCDSSGQDLEDRLAGSSIPSCTAADTEVRCTIPPNDGVPAVACGGSDLQVLLGSAELLVTVVAHHQVRGHWSVGERPGIALGSGDHGRGSARSGLEASVAAAVVWRPPRYLFPRGGEVDLREPLAVDALRVACFPPDKSPRR